MLLVLGFVFNIHHIFVFGTCGWSCEGPINFTAIVLKMTDCRQVQWFYCCCLGSTDCWRGWLLLKVLLRDGGWRRGRPVDLVKTVVLYQCDSSSCLTCCVISFACS